MNKLNNFSPEIRWRTRACPIQCPGEEQARLFQELPVHLARVVLQQNAATDGAV